MCQSFEGRGLAISGREGRCPFGRGMIAAGRGRGCLVMVVVRGHRDGGVGPVWRER